MNNYDAINKTFGEKLREILGEIAQVEQKVAETQTAYHDALGADVMDSDKATAKALTFAKAAWEAARNELAELIKRADILKEMRIKRLQESFPALAEDNRATIQAAREDYERAAADLLRLRAETLVKLQALWQVQQDAHAVHARTEHAAREAGVEHRDRFDMPILNLFGTHGAKDSWLLPLGPEASQALHTGELPAFVRYFALTGELIAEGEAASKLREMTAKAPMAN